jgi:hypothetical protein
LDENKPIDYQVLCWIDDWLVFLQYLTLVWFPGESAWRKQITLGSCLCAISSED